jgi:hypothetical protein
MNNINFRLIGKLAILPLKRSWALLGLMVLSFAQVLLSLWFCGAVQNEISMTTDYADKAHFVTVQMKDGNAPIEPIRELFADYQVGFEELKTEDVLKKMEAEEPEIAQTVRSIGNEGLQLMPRLISIRGVFPESVVDKIKLMTEVYRVDSSPVHHSRLKTFFQHLKIEIRIAVLLILFLILVQLLAFQRLQRRDLSEVNRNLSAWGVDGFQAKLPAFFSLLFLSGISFVISGLEWVGFQKWIWKNNAFLGELSLDRSLGFPLNWFIMGLVVVSAVGIFLSFSIMGSREKA